MLPALVLARLYMRDAFRRPAIWLMLGIGVLAVLSCRWLAIYAMGEELQLFQEYAISSIVVCTTVIAAFAAVPLKRKHDVLAAERVLMTRAVPTLALRGGRCLGIFALVSLATLLWSAAYYLALWLFSVQEPTLFALERDTTFREQAGASVLPLASLLLQGVLIAAVTTFASMRGRLMVTLVALLAYLAFSVAVADWAAQADAPSMAEVLSLFFPDLRMSLARQTFSPAIDAARWLSAFGLQVMGYGALVLVSAAWIKRDVEHA